MDKVHHLAAVVGAKPVYGLKAVHYCSMPEQEALMEQVYVPPVEPLYAELQHFYVCVRHGQKPHVSGEDTLRVLAVADEIEALALRRQGVS